MRTAEEVLKEQWSKYPDEHIDIESVAGQLLLQKIIQNAMKEYAQEAIKTDRENIKNFMIENIKNEITYSLADVPYDLLNTPTIILE